MLKMKWLFFFYSLAKWFFFCCRICSLTTDIRQFWSHLLSPNRYFFGFSISTVLRQGAPLEYPLMAFVPRIFFSPWPFCPFGELNLCRLNSRQGGPSWKRSLFLGLWSQDPVGNRKDSWKDNTQGLTSRADQGPPTEEIVTGELRSLYIPGAVLCSPLDQAFWGGS